MATDMVLTLGASILTSINTAVLWNYGGGVISYLWCCKGGCNGAPMT